jgi:hypothetical protein
MSWALVLWLNSFSNYTIHDRFTSVEDCKESQATMTKALQSVESRIRAVCRPIAR